MLPPVPKKALSLHKTPSACTFMQKLRGKYEDLDLSGNENLRKTFGGQDFVEHRKKFIGSHDRPSINKQKFFLG